MQFVTRRGQTPPVFRNEFHAGKETPVAFTGSRGPIHMVYRLPALCVCLVLVCMWVWTPRPEILQAARLIRPDEHVNPALSSRMWKYLQSQPEQCGVSASNFRAYIQYVLIRSESGGIVEHVNPVVKGYIAGLDREIVVQEDSDMCNVKPQKAAQRHTTIIVESRDQRGGTREHRLKGTEAICMQHFMDVFAGDWPCTTFGADASMVPRQTSE